MVADEQDDRIYGPIFFLFSLFIRLYWKGKKNKQN